MNREQLERELYLLRELKIRKARESFWEFCKLTAPDFYKEDRPHLKLICDTLQMLYEGKLLSPNGEPYKRLMINMPPRHGKSRSLIMFCMWTLGKNNSNRFITCSYGDDLALDFSRYTRDGIMKEKTFPHEVIYQDIFPGTRVARGNSSNHQWALEGQHFTYKGAGIGSGITGKGCNISIVDDPVKNEQEAFNETALDKIWKWYTGTFLSRNEEGSIQIINMTRWAKRDICGRILDGPEADLWYVLKLEAVKSDGTMLCESLLSKRTYESLKINMDPVIFRANYHQEPVDKEGALYKNLKTYDKLPTDAQGNLLFDEIINYTDTADEGDDYLCSICAGILNGEGYILDVYFTKDGMEVTEGKTAEMLIENEVNLAKIESNSGGKSFARNVEREIWERYCTKKVVISWFHQSKNKIARIISNSSFVMKHIYFPSNWNIRWPEFHDDIIGFKREGGNLHDDAEDTLTGIAEMISIRNLTKRSGNKRKSRNGRGAM